MALLYTPPQWKNVGVIQGSLRFGQPTSYCVYRIAGVWYITQNAGVGQTTGADYVFTTPTIIDPSLVAGLTAFGQGTITTV